MGIMVQMNDASKQQVEALNHTSEMFLDMQKALEAMYEFHPRGVKPDICRLFFVQNHLSVSTPTRPPPITETLPNTISFLASTSHALATVGRSLPGTGIIALFARTSCCHNYFIE